MGAAQSRKAELPNSIYPAFSTIEQYQRAGAVAVERSEFEFAFAFASAFA